MNGFGKLWLEIRELELVFTKLGEKSKKLMFLKPMLQSYLDELTWRIQHRTVHERREALYKLLSVEVFPEYISHLSTCETPS